VYEPAMDSQGNWFGTDFGANYVIKMDAKTKELVTRRWKEYGL